MASSRRRRRRGPASAATGAALIALLAGCGGTSPSAGSEVKSKAVAASPAGFTGIVEPFDPGHPAKAQPAQGNCYGQPSTVDIEHCFQRKIENTDAEIDAVQRSKFAAASPAGRTAILAQDKAWLNAREPVCAVAFNSGGTIDGIKLAACLLDESTARLSAVKGLARPAEMFKSTDNPDPSGLSWYTTPEGSRIAELDTQGDQTGTGAIISWIIIGGAKGFIINPRQFYFTDGSFTDYGVVLHPNPSDHRVATGAEYTFGIDYSHLSQAPDGGRAGGFAYVPGTAVAIWH